MADDDKTVTVELSAESKAALKEQVAAFPAKLKDEMRKGLEDQGAQVVAEMKRRLLQSPPTSARSVKGKPHNSRRQAAEGLAATANVTADGATLEFSASARQMGPGHTVFPWAYNTPSWRHPVFGRSDEAEQKGRPFFGVVVKESADKIEAALDKAIDKAAETVKGERA